MEESTQFLFKPFEITGNPCNVSCSEERPWVEGATLFNYLNAVRLQGITGSIALQGRKRGNKSIQINMTCN